MHQRFLSTFLTAFFAFLTLALLPWHASADSQRAVALPMPASHYVPALLPDPADWPMYGHDPQRTNYNPAETLIIPAAINSLVQRWVFNLGNSSPTSGAPSVANGRVYAGSSITSGDNFFALDAVTGGQAWSTSVGHGNNCFSVGIGSSSVVSGTVLSVGGGDLAYYGLNSDTGAQLWREPMNVGSSGFPWCSPLLAYGRSYLGMASCADNPSVRGEVRAIDMTSGANLGSQYFVPAGNAGAGIWNSPALSPDGSTLVVATGEDFGGYNGPYNRAIVSLDPITLSILQSNQQGSLNGDLDYAATPIFFSDSLGRTLVGGLHKNHIFYAYEINSINSGPIWSRNVVAYSAGMMPAYDPTFGTGGTLFVATSSRIYALNPDNGLDRWPFISVSGLHGNMAIANGLIFLNVGGNLQIRDEVNNGALLRTITPAIGGSTYTGPVLSHGFVYWLSGAWLNAWSLPATGGTPTVTPTPGLPTSTSTSTATPTNTPLQPTSTSTSTRTSTPSPLPTDFVTASPTPSRTPTRTSTATPTSTPSATTGATATCVPQGTIDFVTIYDNYFSPQNITILAGTRVLWTNNNDHSYAHTTTSDSAAYWDSGPLNDGQQFGYSFYTPGTYTYHCSIHPSMTGSVIVQPANPCPTATSTLVPPTPTGNTAVVTFTPTTTSTSTPCTITFTDVDPDNTFYTYIRCLVCRGIISGYDDGTFRPFNDITRSQIAKIVSNAAGFSEDPGPQVFEDVNDTNPFYQYINRLSNRGHMGGYPCGTVDAEPCNPPDNRPYFRPFANATRGQLAKIVANAANVGGTPSGVFYTDVEEEHPFYLWIMRLTDIGVMSGYDCGGEGEPCDPQNRPYFRPYNNVTRGQASKIVANTFYPDCQTPAR